MNERFFGSWGSAREVHNSFAKHTYDSSTMRYVDEQIADFPKDEEILFASYGGGGYDGDALVLFQRDGKLYEVHGGHCSCYGLEDQWDPGEVTWAALALRPREGYSRVLYDHDSDAVAAFWALVDANTSGVKA